MELSPTPIIEPIERRPSPPPIPAPASNEVPVATILDNELSMLYKWGNYYNVAVKNLVALATEVVSSRPEFLEIVPAEILQTSVVVYIPFIALVTILINEGKTPDQVYDFVISPDVTLFSSITNETPPTIWEDVAMALATLFLPEIITLLEQGTGAAESLIEVLISNINAVYAHAGQTNTIQNYEALLTQQRVWEQNNKRARVEDQKILNIMLSLQDKLAAYPPIPATVLNLTSMDIKLRFKIGTTTEGTTTRDVEPTDGIDIFNLSHVNSDVPYIQYNEKTRLTSAPTSNVVATSATMSTVPKYYKIWSELPSNKIPETVGNREIDKFFILTRLQDNNYGVAEYDLQDNILTLRVPLSEHFGPEIALQRLTTSIPLQIGSVRQTRVTGTFEIPNLLIYETILLDLILTDPLMNSYLYVDELSRPFALASRLSVHFKSVVSSTVERHRTSGTTSDTKGDQGAKEQEEESLNPSSVSANLFQNYYDSPRRLTVLNESNVLIEMDVPAGTPYVTVNITRASSEIAAEQFIEIFRRLLGFYIEQQDTIREEYQRFFPNATIQPRSTPTTPKTQRTPRTPGTQILQPIRTVEEIIDPTNRSRNKRLKMLAPDLIVTQYARTCQPIARYPDILTPEEAQAWQESTFDFDGRQRKRQVMSFPPQDPQWLFVCPHPKYPFPGVSANTRMANKEKYPYVPCCFVDDQMRPGTNTSYNEYIGAAAGPVSRKAATNIVTAKALDYQRTGNLLPLATQFLSNTITHPARLGIVRSPSSLLHCVLYAINYKPYAAATNDQQREEVVQKLRKQLARRYNMESLRQEFYDLSVDEIRARVDDVNLFMDTSTFYHLLEVVFNVNIYTITTITNNERETVALEVPRYSQFPIRIPHPKLKTVLIYKSLGSESNNLSYPQCDLIIDRDPSTNRRTVLHLANVTEFMIQAFQAMYQTFTWIPTRTGVSGHLNLNSQIDYLTLFGGKTMVSAQIIDAAGKQRGLLLSNGILATFPASQPENLPGVDIANFNPPSLEQVLAYPLFTNPSGILKQGDILRGLWYPLLDFEYGLFVIVRPVLLSSIPENLRNLPVGPANDYLLLTVSGTNRTDQIEEMRRTVDRLLQLVLWIYRIYFRQYPNVNNRDVLRNFLRTLDVGQEPRYIYNLNSLPQRLPPVQNYQEGIAYLSTIAPTLIRNGKIFVSSPKLLEGLAYFLQLYLETNSRNEPLNNMITGLYTKASDFREDPQTLIFVTEKAFRDWQNSLLRNTLNLPVRKMLETSYGITDDPYIYLSPEGRTFLVQNVIVDQASRYRAINVSYYWEHYNINAGRNMTPYLTEKTVSGQTERRELPPYVVYTISTINSLAVLEDHTNGAAVFLEILYYGAQSGKYGAMLPLL